MLWPFGQGKKRRKKTKRKGDINSNSDSSQFQKNFLAPKQSRKDEKKNVFKESSFCHSSLSLHTPSAHISSLIAHF